LGADLAVAGRIGDRLSDCETNDMLVDSFPDRLHVGGAIPGSLACSFRWSAIDRQEDEKRAMGDRTKQPDVPANALWVLPHVFPDASPTSMPCTDGLTQVRVSTAF
jgi:hypothetical protein